MNKKRRVLAAGCIWMLLIFCGFCVSAGDGADYGQRAWVRDEAGLLTVEEAEDLNETCVELAVKHDIGISIITVDDFGGGDIQNWQRGLYEDSDLGAGDADSGLMLAISMAERDWGLVAFGDAQDIFNTYSREKIAELFLDDLSAGNYYDSFSTYLKLCDKFMTEAENGTPYSADNPYKKSVPVPLIIGISFLISLAVSVVVVISWKKAMNTRILQNGAGNYFKEESFALTKCTDKFLYHTVSRTKRQQAQSGGSSGTSGMSSSHSGTSGKF